MEKKLNHIALFESYLSENTYLFFYAFGAYGSTYAQGKGKTQEEGLKDAFANYAHGIGGADPSPSERRDFIKEAILIATFTPEGEVIENDKSIVLLSKALA